MSLSLAESIIDVNQLLDGGAVPVYKTKNNMEYETFRYDKYDKE